MIFAVGNFCMGSLSGRVSCWCWKYLFFIFPSNSQGPLLQDCCRSTPDPARLGITWGGCRTVRVAAGFFFCYLHPRRVPARCQPELSFLRYLWIFGGCGAAWVDSLSLIRAQVLCRELCCYMQSCWAGIFKSAAVDLITTSFPGCSDLGRLAFFL